MSRYERNGYVNDKENKENKDDKEKPLYYNDYFISNNEERTEKCSYIFISLLTLFVFFTSITDIIYSYLPIDECQEETYFTTLNDWLRINGTLGICYYFFLVIILYSLSKYSYKGYTRLINTQEKKISETCESIYKICGTILTILLLIVLSIGMYMYLSYFCKYCQSNAIIIYMWIRLLSGIVIHLGILFYINI